KSVDIGGRAKKILHAVVSEYLATGEAVGSQTVTRRYGLDVSAATVRTVMGELEEVGLLRHAHTSGGRLPTERGLRYYVDMLLRVRSLTAGEKDEMRERLAPAGGDVPEVMQRTTRMLRELSHLTVVVQAPRPDSDVVQHLEFVQMRDGQLLAVIAAASGQIQNKLIPVDAAVSPSELDRINNFLNGLVSGLTLEQVRARLVEEIASERTTHDQLVARALKLATAAVPVDPTPEVLVDGQSNLLAGKADLERAKLLLRTLEEKDLVVRLLERTLSAPGICVFIGAEANLADLTDVSVVAAPYLADGRALGTVGVIGPSRMNYSRVIPLVDFTAEMIGEALGKS
ncbi:MAG TPA: heat-inducible transcriptional repressor HrcA, partial [Polyangia bacterium]|nr:heat-inducible transcriptional repressor HrcA [Polyangia bacterium]